jgi:secreted trypsin-like serine protease
MNRLLFFALLYFLLTALARKQIEERRNYVDTFRRFLFSRSHMGNKSINLRHRGRNLQNSTSRVEGEAQSRIIGGTPVPEGRYPYLAALFKRDPKNGLMAQVCGGSLISPTVILTAAHCSDSIDLAIIGLRDITNFQGKGYEYHDISADQKEIYPSYDPGTHDGDFLLLFLKNPSKATPVRLNSNPMIPSDGQQLTVIGWGLDQTGSPTKIPEETVVQAVSNSKCTVRYALAAATSVTHTQLCASGGSTHDSCQGDSGGPLIVKGDNADNDLLVGVVSWGSDCADSFFPGVYARVSSVTNWLQSKVPEAKFNNASSDVSASESSSNSSSNSECWNLIFFNWC